MKEKIAMRNESQILNQMTVRGNLGTFVDSYEDSLRSTIRLDEENDKVEFTTIRPFDTKDSLDRILELDTIVPLSIASGSQSDSWEERTDHGRVNLFFNSIALENVPAPEPPAEVDEIVREPFDDARIGAYEKHGWITMVAWFPLGFALLATKRYYKTRWYLMHTMHNTLGAGVVVATIITCLQAYAHVGWE